MSGRAVAALALAGVAVGTGIALAVNVATDQVYRAAAVLRAVPPPGQPDRTAATYAELAEARGFLEERAGVTPERVGTRHREGTDLVEVFAHGPSGAEARALADRLAAALVADASRLADRRAARVESELQARIGELSGAIAEVESTAGSLQSAATVDRLRSLRSERAAVQARLADAAATAAQDEMALTVAAPAASNPDPIRPRRVLNVFGGILLGLVAGLGSSLLLRGSSARPEAQPAETAADDAPPPVVELLHSDGSPDWNPLQPAHDGNGQPGANRLAPGRHWLCARVSTTDGRAHVTEPVPIVVAHEEQPQPDAL